MKTRAQIHHEKIKADPVRYAARLKQLRAAADRQIEKEKANPELWAARIEKQRQRRDDPNYRQEMYRKESERQYKLPDSVVAHRLGMKTKDCPKDLIELKRLLMKANRLLGTKIQTP